MIKKPFWKIAFFSFLIFFFSWLFVYKTGVNSLSIQSEDTLPAIFLPLSIIKDKSFYLDDYLDMMKGRYPHPDDKDYKIGLTPFYLRKVGEHYLSAFTLIPGVLATPIYLIPVVLGVPASWDVLFILSHLSAAAIVALSGAVLYALVRKHFFCDKKNSLLITSVYLFGTVNFGSISQALWQHGVLQLFVLLGLWFLYEKRLFLSSLMLGLAVLSRPTAVVFFPFLFLLMIYLSQGEKESKRSYVFRALSFLVGILPPLLFFLWYNSRFYLSFSNQGYAGQLLGSWLSRFPEGFLGLWFSPSKGILVYSPVLIFSLFGLWLAVRGGRWRSNFEYIIFGSVVLVHTLILGRWKHWYGGWSFGYRMASDILPFLVLMIVPYFSSSVFEKTKKFFYILFAVSVGVQVWGIIFFDGVWHAAYDRGFRNTSWLWSVKDSEFVFNVRRILVKLGLMERACPKCLPK